MKHVYKIFILLSIVLLLACQSKNKKQEPVKIPAYLSELDSLFTRHFEEGLFQGGIVISKKGEVLYEEYFGEADRAWGIPVDANVKFDIASVNKSMIAALTMKAVEEGRLNLGDRLIDLLSGFEIKGTFHPGITLHHLLSHTSGLPDYDAVSEELRADRFTKFKRCRFNNEDYVDFISQLPAVNEPNQQFYYSNFAYHLLAIVLEMEFDMGFDQILQEYLTQPLGLANTVSSSRNEEIIDKLANAYLYDDGRKEWIETPYIDLSLGRRIFSTPSDLNRWALVMNNPGYLSQASLDLIQKNHLAGISKDVSYGYGWVTVNKDNPSKMGDLGIELPYIIHGGSTDGYKAMLVNIGGGELVISFLSNVGNKTNELDLAQKIVNLLIK